MMNTFYVKIDYYSENDEKEHTYEFFTRAESYEEALSQVAHVYGNGITAIKMYEMMSDFIYVDDFQEMLAEARSVL